MKDLIAEKKFILILLGSVLLIVGGIWFYYHQNNDNILVIDQNALDKNGVSNNQKGLVEEQEESGVAEVPNEIMVHIIGQIKNPGVITLKEGTRLIEAIEKLGGPLEEADLDAVNLSQKLVDEQKIYIPKIGEVETVDSLNNTIDGTQEQGQRININTSTKDELKTLPGIGDVISENIINYREKNGSFKSIEEIKEVNRIGDKIFNDIKDRIRI